MTNSQQAKHEFVAVKNQTVYPDANPLKPMDLLRADGVNTAHTFIEFVK